MEQENKELLLRDLSARLPHGAKIATRQYNYCDICTPKGIVGDRCYFNDNPRYDGDCPIDNVKPYLRSMSSMTEEEKEEFRSLGGIMSYSPQHDHWAISAFTPEAYDWLNSNNFDYRGLIPMGLALEAPEGMYKL